MLIRPPGGARDTKQLGCWAKTPTGSRDKDKVVGVLVGPWVDFARGSLLEGHIMF